MSWGVDIEIDHADGYTTSVEVVDGHTYNLTAMWAKAGVFDRSSDLQGRNAGQLAPILSAAVIHAIRHRVEYEALAPANGWGDYEGFLEILIRFCELTWAHPTGTLRWNG